MAQQTQEPHPDELQSKHLRRKPPFQLSLAIAIILFILFCLVFLTIIVILSNVGIINVSGLKNLSLIFLGVVIPVLAVIVSLIQLFHSFATHKNEAIIHSSHTLPDSLASNSVQISSLDDIYNSSIDKPQINESTTSKKEVNTINNAYQNLHTVDWGEAPQVENFYNRSEERTYSEQWIVKDHCQLMAVLGIGGIGKSLLVSKLVEHIKDEFNYVFWRELKNAPPLESILKSCVQFVSNQQQIDLPANTDEQISILIQYLRAYRCLVILDNIETILQSSNRAGHYREGYEGYGRLFQLIGEAHHQSCLILTSREKPNEIARLEGKISPVRTLQLSGLSLLDGQEILKDKGLFGSNEACGTLIDLYSGNPLALKLASEPVRELFKGDISAFLGKGEAVVGDIYELLSQQFQRLSSQEREIMYWLAIEREAISLDNLQEDFVRPIAKKELLEVLRSLRRRSMIEASGIGHFTLQPVIMEFVTDHFIEQIIEEIDSEIIQLLGSHALIKAQTKDYIRDSQARVILKPIAKRLHATFGEGIDIKLSRILSSLRRRLPQKSEYAAGNILNLLVQLQSNLHGYDFSYLTVYQAYLREVTLEDVDFSHATFEKSAFTDNFGSILSVAYSPDGNLLAVGTSNGDIRIWQASSGTLLATFLGHTDWVWSISFSPDGRLLASGSSDQTVRLWDTDTGQCLNTLQGHNNRIYSVSFSSDGKLLASGSSDQTVRLWDPSTGQCLNTLLGHSSWIYSVAFSPNGRLLASGSEDQTVRLWDLSTGQLLNTLQDHNGWIYSVSFSPDGGLLASGSSDQTVRLWDTSTGQCLNILQGHSSWVNSVAFNRDGSTIASSSEDQTVRLWDTNTGQCLNTLLGHRGRIRAVVFNPDANTVASGSEDQTVRLWDPSTGQLLNTLHGYTDRIRSVAFSPNGNTIVTSSEDQTVRLWNPNTGQCLSILHGHRSWVYSVAFSPDGKLLASGSEDQTIRLWDPSTGQCLNTLQGHKSKVRSVAFSPDGKLLASGSEDQTIRLWDPSTGQCLNTLQGHKDKVWNIAFSPDGRLLASGSEDQTIRLWDPSTGQCLNTLQGHANRVWAVTFSPDGKSIASGGHDQTVRLWDSSTGQCLNTLHGHTSIVYTVAFSPDGKSIASGSHDQTVRLWDSSTGQCLNTLHGHTNRVWAVAFSPNGKLIASGSYDGTVRLREARTGKNFKTLRSNRPYERVNIFGVKGLTEAQKAALRGLGAIEVPKAKSGKDIC